MMSKKLLFIITLIISYSSVSQAFGGIKMPGKKMIENGKEFINDRFVFDDQAVQLKGEEIKQSIKKRQQENLRYMKAENQNHIAKMRLSEEINRGTNCDPSEISSRLQTAIELNCRPLQIESACSDKLVGVNENLDTFNNRLASFSQKLSNRENVSLEQLTQFQSEVWTGLNSAFESNQACLKSTQENVMSNDCISSYEQVFNESMNNFIRYSCPPSAVDHAVSNFVITMRDPAAGPGHMLKQVQHIYGLSRNSEVEMAGIFISIQELIKAEKAKRQATQSATAQAPKQTARPQRNPSKTPDKKISTGDIEL